MKILQFMPEFGLAGAEIMCENLTYELIKRGHEVIVVSLYNYYSPITERLMRNNIQVLFLGKKLGLDLSIVKKIRHVIKSERPDIMHTHRYLLKYVALATIGLRTNIIVHTLHNIAQKENKSIDRIINRNFFKSHKAIPVALSSKVQDSVAAVYGISREKIPIVHNGIKLSNSFIREKYDFGDVIRIIHVGRLMDVKNHANLIRAIVNLHAINNKVRLYLYGDGPLKSNICKMIHNLGADGYIYYKGLSDNISEKLNESDIFVLPSIYEGLPMTIIEAMNAALPIIASNVGGIPDMIRNGIDGLLCETDTESIMNALNKVINSQSLREKIGRSAFERAHLFSSEQMAESYINIYNSVVESQ